ncbi:MAG: helix-turn-helix transcriptional regulator [Oscillospiraceae bacterium]|nr:helix-turn-helix transcriptional regulator [Oscillospiraceae bacterium]
MEAIKRLREAAGLSQDTLARTLQVDRSTVAKWETSGVYPRGDKLPELADALCCSIDALYGRTPPEGRRENHEMR